MKDKVFKLLENTVIFGFIFLAVNYILNNQKLFVKVGLDWKASLAISCILFFLKKPLWKIIKPLTVIFVFFPTVTLNLEKLMIHYHWHVHPVVKWIIVATLVSGLVAAYAFGFKLLKALFFRIYSSIWDSIGKGFSFIYNKTFGKRYKPCKIDLTIEQIDAFGDPQAADYAVQKGYMFEDFVAEMYRTAGYDAKTTTELRALKMLPPAIQKTGGSGEQGVDVIVKYPLKNGGYHVLAIQCKHYSNTVSNSAVQQIHSALQLYKANQACVITNNYFTKPAHILAESLNVLMVDRDSLQEMIKKVVKKHKEENKKKMNWKPFTKSNVDKEETDGLEKSALISEIKNSERKTAVVEYDNQMKKMSEDKVIPITKEKHKNDAFWNKMKRGA